MIDRARNESATLPSEIEEVLVSGAFEGGDAADAVLGLMDAILSFHQLQDMRSQVRTETPDLNAREHSRALRTRRDELQRMLADLRDSGARVRLKSTIQIEVEHAALSREQEVA